MAHVTFYDILHWTILGGPDIKDIRVGEITISLIDERDPDGHPLFAALRVTDLKVHRDASGQPLPGSDYWLTGDLMLKPRQGWTLKQVRIKCNYTGVGHFVKARRP